MTPDDAETPDLADPEAPQGGGDKADPGSVEPEQQPEGSSFGSTQGELELRPA